MSNLKLSAENIKHFGNITSHSECNALCKRESECALWTYHSGRCLFKNNMVYTVENPLVTSGEKYCNDSGRIVTLPTHNTCIYNTLEYTNAYNMWFACVFSDCALKGTDYYGGDIFMEALGNATECAIRCQEENVCKRWSFVENPDYQNCSLMKDANMSIVVSHQHNSGFRNSGEEKCGYNGNWTYL